MNSTQPVGWVGVDGDNRVLVENVDNAQPTGSTIDQLIKEGFQRR